LAEVTACRHDGVGDLAAVAGEIDHFDTALDDEVDVAAVAVAIEDLFAGGKPPPLAGALDLKPGSRRQFGKQLDLLKAVGCRRRPLHLAQCRIAGRSGHLIPLADRPGWGAILTAPQLVRALRTD